MEDSERHRTLDSEMARMRAQAPTWNLAADHSLLQLLENMHENIVSKAKDTNAKMDGLLCQLNDADVYLNNVNNRFMALSNTQFVENRVYDDDVEVTPVTLENDSKNEISKGADGDTWKEQDDMDMKELDLQATVSALVTLESYHEQIRIVPDSDSETDDDTEISMMDSLVLRPKDLYERRPLPHIIGSEQWKAKCHVGLVEEDSSTDSDDDQKRAVPQPEQFSSSEDETDGEDIHTASEIGKIKGKMTLPLPGKLSKDMELSESDNEDMKSDLSERLVSTRGHSQYNNTETFIKPQSTATASNFAAELAKRLGAPLPPKSDFDAPSQPQSIPKEQKTSVKSYSDGQRRVPSNIFSDEPPPLDQTNDLDDQLPEDYETDTQDESDIFADLRGTSKANKNVKSLFSNSGNTASEYGDLFANLESPVEAKSSNVYTPSRVDLFDEFESKSSFMEKKIDNKVEPIKSTVTKSEVRNLFDSDSDSGDIFGAIPKRSKDSPKSVQKDVPRHKGGLFDDDSDTGDLFPTEVAVKRPSSKPSVVAVDKSQVDTPKSVNLFTDSDTDSPPNVADKEHDVYKSEDTVSKKPIGGVSMFKGNESNIAAAILKHRPRQSSSSDSSDSETIDGSDKTVINRLTNVSQNIPHGNSPKDVSDVPKVKADSIFRDTKINEIYNHVKDDYDLFSEATQSSEGNKLPTKKSEGDLFSESRVIKQNSKDIRNNNLFSEGTKDTEDLLSENIESDNLCSKDLKVTEYESLFSKRAKNIEDDNLFSKHIKDDNLFSEHHVKADNLYSKDIKDDNLSLKDDNLFSKDMKDDNLFSRDIRNDNTFSKDEPESRDIDLFSKIAIESKPVIKAKPQLPKTENAEDGETKKRNKIQSSEDVSKQNNSDREKDTPVIPAILQDGCIPKTSKLKVDRDVSPSLFSDEASPFSKDDFDDIFHSEPPEFEPEQIKPNNSLFDDGDDVDDIFSSNAGFKTLPPKGSLFGEGEIPQAPQRKVGIFDDEPPDFDDDSDSNSRFQNEIKYAKPKDIKSLNSSGNDKTRDIITEKSLESAIDSRNSCQQPSVSEPVVAKSTDDLFDSSADDAGAVKNLDNIFTDSKNMFRNMKRESNAMKSGGSIFDEMNEERETIFRSTPESAKAETKAIFNDDDDDELFKPSPRSNDSPTVDINEDDNTIISAEKIIRIEKSAIDNILKLVDIKNKSKENAENLNEKHLPEGSPTRVVGKLKPSTLKINVHSLKPGAIPKFGNKSSESDTNCPITKEEIDGRIMKSMSFDESTNPSVLANMSKDRPKIQVKRKPSTRKGRQDALRKSAADLNADKELPLSTNDLVDSYICSLPTSPQEVKLIDNSFRRSGYTSDHKQSNTTKGKLVEEKPNITKEKPIITSEKPDISNKKPNISKDKPNITIEKPDVTSEKPNTSKGKSSISEKKPNITNEKPDTSKEKFNISKEKSNISKEKSNITNEKPDIQNEKPSISKEKPKFIGKKPNKSKEKPNIPIEKPDISKDKLNISNEKPSITNEKPNIAHEKPSITNDKVDISSENLDIASDNPVRTTDTPNEIIFFSYVQPDDTDETFITKEKSEEMDTASKISSQNEITNPIISENESNSLTEEFVNVDTLGKMYKDEIKSKSAEIGNVFDKSGTGEPKNTTKTSSNDLFDELFKPASGHAIDKSIATIPKISDSTEDFVSETSVSKPNLFDDSQTSEEELFASKKSILSTKKTSLLFADDFDDEDLFGAKIIQKSVSKNISSPTETHINKAESRKTDLVNERNTEKKKKDTLFFDSDSEDLFATKFEKVKIKVKTEKLEKKVPEDDLFSSVKKSVFSKETTKCLFEDDEDESDIFGAKKKQASSSKSSSKPKEESNEKTRPQTTSKTQSVPSSAEQVFKDPLSSFDND